MRAGQDEYRFRRKSVQLSRQTPWVWQRITSPSTFSVGVIVFTIIRTRVMQSADAIKAIIFATNPILVASFFLSVAYRIVQNGRTAASAVKYAVKSNMFAHTVY